MKNVIIFTIGAATGALVTWKIVEKKYKKLADEEIESVVQRFKNRDKVTGEIRSTGLNIVEPYTETKTEVSVATYENVVDNLGYATDDDSEKEEKKDYAIYTSPFEDDVPAPYTIPPEEYGEVDIYNDKSLIYYADYVLTDEEGEIISDPESIIGDALSHFGEYGDNDAVYVRNERTECDYEIIKHDATFSDVYGS